MSLFQTPAGSESRCTTRSRSLGVEGPAGTDHPQGLGDGMGLVEKGVWDVLVMRGLGEKRGDGELGMGVGGWGMD